MLSALQRNEIQRELAGELQSATFLAFASHWSVALDAGLTAAAEVYQEAVKARLERGYTSGAFAGMVRIGVTGARFPGGTVANSVRLRKPRFDRNGIRYVAVGSNNFLARLWEFGHDNPWTRRHERVEHWRMAMVESGDEMGRAFHDVFDTVLGQGPTVTARAA